MLVAAGTGSRSASDRRPRRAQTDERCRMGTRRAVRQGRAPRMSAPSARAVALDVITTGDRRGGLFQPRAAGGAGSFRARHTRPRVRDVARLRNAPAPAAARRRDCRGGAPAARADHPGRRDKRFGSARTSCSTRASRPTPPSQRPSTSSPAGSAASSMRSFGGSPPSRRSRRQGRATRRSPANRPSGLGGGRAASAPRGRGGRCGGGPRTPGGAHDPRGRRRRGTAGAPGRAVRGGRRCRGGTVDPACLTLDGGDPRALPGWAEGRFAVQDQASAFVTRVVDPQPGDFVYDACAAPGGKALHLTELVAPDGRVLAADRSATRVGLIATTAGRLDARPWLVVQDAISPPSPRSDSIAC